MPGWRRRLVPDEALMEVATAFAERFADCPLQSLVATKQLMLQAHLANIRQIRELEGASLKRLLGTPANLAAVKAFAERSRKS